MAAAKPALRGLITGASSGIGRVLAQQLSEQYTLSVTLIGRKESALKAVADDVAAAGGVAHAVVCDVSNFDQVEAAWKQHVETVGSTDFLVLNAGLNRPGSVHEITEEHFDEVMAVNIKGVWAWLPHAVPAMKAAGSGQIVVTSSVLGTKSVPGMGAYCASKYAVQGLIGSLRQELAGSGVKAATVNPGAVNTPWWTEKDRGAKDAKPDIDFLEPDDVAAAIVNVIKQSPSSDIDQVLLMPAARKA